MIFICVNKIKTLFFRKKIIFSSTFFYFQGTPISNAAVSNSTSANNTSYNATNEEIVEDIKRDCTWEKECICEDIPDTTLPVSTEKAETTTAAPESNSSSDANTTTTATPCAPTGNSRKHYRNNMSETYCG